MKRLIVLICNFHIPFQKKKKKKKAQPPLIPHARNFLSAWEKGSRDGGVSPPGSKTLWSPRCPLPEQHYCHGIPYSCAVTHAWRSQPV